MKVKVIKNWKVIGDNLDSVTAFKIFNNRVINGQQYDIVGLRLGNRSFQSNLDVLDNKAFSCKEVLSNKWEIMIPDDNMEAITNKLRTIVKEEHFTGLNYDKIDNMSIDEIWAHIRDYKLNSLDRNAKYRLIKFIIENKLYKTT